LCDVLDIKNDILVNLYFRGIPYDKQYEEKFQEFHERIQHLNQKQTIIENKQYKSLDDLIYDLVALEENKSNPDKVFAAIQNNEKFAIQNTESLAKAKQAVSQSNAVNNSATNAVNNSATNAVNNSASNLYMLLEGCKAFIAWLLSPITWVAQKCGIVQSNTQSPRKN
jgi:hypothetical protein